MAGGRSGVGRDGVRAIVVAAGRGLRLDPYTRRCPKPLLYVAGRPILGHLLDSLRATGIADLVVVVGYLGEQIVAYLRTRHGPPPRIVVQEELLGNGHAVYAARAYLDGPVLVLFGDTIPIADLSAPLRTRTGAASIGVTEVEDGRAYGIVDVSDDGRVRRIWEKPAIPPSRCAVAGVFFFPGARPLRDALESLVTATGGAPPVPGSARLPPLAGGDPGSLRDPRPRPAGPPGGEVWFVDAIQRMIDHGHPVETFPVDRFYDCGTAEQMLTANRELLAAAAVQPGGHGGADPSDAAGAGTHVAAAFSNTVIEAPCAVSPEAAVVDAHIGPFVTVAPGARIVHARVSDAVVLPGAVIEDETIEHAIIDTSRGMNGHARGD